MEKETLQYITLSAYGNIAKLIYVAMPCQLDEEQTLFDWIRLRTDN